MGFLGERAAPPVFPNLKVDYFILPAVPNDLPLLHAGIEAQGRLVARGLTSQLVSQHRMADHLELEPPYEVLSRFGNSAAALVLLGGIGMDIRTGYLAEWQRSANRLHWISLFFDYGVQQVTVEDLTPFENVGLYPSGSDRRNNIAMHVRPLRAWPFDERLAAAIKTRNKNPAV